MKRCNNCGWFNLDTATRCEMCDDESLEPVVIEQQSVPEPVAETVPEFVSEPVSETKPEPVELVAEPVVEAVPEPEPVPVAEEKVRKPMMETVAFGAPAAVAPSHKNYAATMMDVREFVEEGPAPSGCPKCNYPVSGGVDFCPNCGATVRKPAPAEPNPTKKEIPAEPKQVGMATVRIGDSPAPAPEEKKGFLKTVRIGGDVTPSIKKTGSLKATVRDIPEELVVEEDKDIFRLVPVDDMGEAPVEMHLDDVVIISGRRYKFQK